MFMTGVLCTVCGAQVYLIFLSKKGTLLAPKFQKKKISFSFFWSVFDDQGFASFYQIFCYKISWNYLKFRGRESEHSLILNLNPSPNDKFYMSNGIILRENKPVLL